MLYVIKVSCLHLTIADYTPSLCFLWCHAKLLLWEKHFPQWLHWNGFSPECVLWHFKISALRVNHLSQWFNLYGIYVTLVSFIWFFPSMYLSCVLPDFFSLKNICHTGFIIMVFPCVHSYVFYQITLLSYIFVTLVALIYGFSPVYILWWVYMIIIL